MAYLLKGGRELGAVDQSTFVSNYNVRRGSRNENVRTVQFLLNVFGANLVTDAIFGPLTEAATKAFQKANGLVQDGIVGPITSRALQDDESRNIGQSPPANPPSAKGPVTASSGKTGLALALALALAAAGAGVVIHKRKKKRSNPRRKRSNPRRKRKNPRRRR